MASQAQLQSVQAIADRVAVSCGLEIFDIQLRRESRGWVLRIIIDRPPEALGEGRSSEPEVGVGIEDCQRVSQDVSAILDVEDPLDHPYTLEVSSPGLDRPLRHAGDYARFVGRLAKIVVAEAVDGQKSLAGRLQALDNETVVLEGVKGRIHRIPLPVITRARLDVEL